MYKIALKKPTDIDNGILSQILNPSPPPKRVKKTSQYLHVYG